MHAQWSASHVDMSEKYVCVHVCVCMNVHCTCVHSWWKYEGINEKHLTKQRHFLCCSRPQPRTWTWLWVERWHKCSPKQLSPTLEDWLQHSTAQYMDIHWYHEARQILMKQRIENKLNSWQNNKPRHKLPLKQNKINPDTILSRNKFINKYILLEEREWMCGAGGKKIIKIKVSTQRTTYSLWQLPRLT